MGLCDRMEELGRAIGEREAPHTTAIELARAKAESLHASLCDAFGRFHAAAKKAGAEHLQIVVGPVRHDEKHLRAVEFDVTRGRYRTVITVKSRGEVTLVGPFRKGGAEGPCRTFPIDADAEVEAALGEVLERFLEEATTP